MSVFGDVSAQPCLHSNDRPIPGKYEELVLRQTGDREIGFDRSSLVQPL